MNEQKVEVIWQKGEWVLEAREFSHLGTYGVEITTDVLVSNGERKTGLAKTAPLTAAEANAFALWWLRKHPSLLSQVLSEKQKEAINDAIERTEATAGECYTDASYRAVTHHLSALKSIITPEEG